MGVAWMGHLPDFEITFERIELSASNLVQRWRTDPVYIRSAQCLRLSERFFMNLCTCLKAAKKLKTPLYLTDFQVG